MSMMKKCVVLSFLAIVTIFGGIRPPGKYNGVVIFDRWGACHLYSGVFLMEVSEKVKDSLRAFEGKAMLIDAQEIYQPINPGDGLITKLQVLGPAVETNLDGLTLRAIPNFPAQGPDELIIELRNDGARRHEIDTDALGPTLLSKKQGLLVFNPADGPSYAAVTRANVRLLLQGPSGGSGRVNGKDRIAKISLAPGIAISERYDLKPGQTAEVPLRFELSPGEYEFLAGYGGGVHAARTLVSNQVDFDVDDLGKAHLTHSAGVSRPGALRR